jgi:hypothetical protein
MPSREVRAQRRAQAFGYEGEGFTLEEWLALVESYGGVCLACGVAEDLSVDHIVPLSLGGSNAISNIQPLCETCNSLKGATIRDYRPSEARRASAWAERGDHQGVREHRYPHDLRIRRNMPTETQTVFGEVLAELMEERGISVTPEEIVTLGGRAGLDGKELLRDVTRGIPGRRARQHLTGLADELGLTEREKVQLAIAYTLERRSLG